MRVVWKYDYLYILYFLDDLLSLICSLGRSNLVDGKMVREYQVRWEGCSSKFDSWELQEKIQKADPAAVYRFNLEMAACFGTAKPRAGGGASAQHCSF